MDITAIQELVNAIVEGYRETMYVNVGYFYLWISRCLIRSLQLLVRLDTQSPGFDTKTPLRASAGSPFSCVSPSLHVLSTIPCRLRLPLQVADFVHTFPDEVCRLH